MPRKLCFQVNRTGPPVVVGGGCDTESSACAVSLVQAATGANSVFSGDLHGCFRLDRKRTVEVNLPVDPFTVLWVLDEKEV